MFAIVKTCKKAASLPESWLLRQLKVQTIHKVIVWNRKSHGFPF